MSEYEYRSGVGYDVHQFAEGRDCILGGVKIPHSKGLLGHSDADVLCHAIADSILGALGLPDIGFYFPPSDQSIEGICSLEILKTCANLAQEKGARIVNVDSMLIAEEPKVMKYRDAMVENLSTALSIQPHRVNIKATTNETMGFVGRGEGIAAMATCSIAVPWEA